MKQLLHISLCLIPLFALLIATPARTAESFGSNSSYNASQSHDITLISEDVTWRGNMLIRGAVVVQPQATLRIEAGTVIRFAPLSAGSSLVIQGRIHCAGSAERPVVLTSDNSSWTGIVVLSSDKKNLIELCRIDNAETAIDARFSSLSLKNVTINKSRTGLEMTDATVQVYNSVISDCATAMNVQNSELDMRDTVIQSGKNGIVGRTSSLAIVAGKFSNNEQYALQADDCRLKIVTGEFAGNGYGAVVKGGEGLITATRFVRNRNTALNLSSTRIRVTRSLFADNSGDALQIDGGQSVLWGNAFVANNGYNIRNAGRTGVLAVQNWWGASDAETIMSRILDAGRDQRLGPATVFPWLTEKPVTVPN